MTTSRTDRADEVMDGSGAHYNPEDFDGGICDVNGCGVEAVRCSVGEAGDFWFCEEHWKEATGE